MIVLTEIKHTINVMCLSQPETTLYPSLPWSLEKTVFHETVPGCQKSWGPLPSRIPVVTTWSVCTLLVPPARRRMSPQAPLLS